MVFFPAIANAYDANIDGIYYDFDSNNRTATVTFQTVYVNNENAYSGDVVIPENVNYNGISYRVTKIGYDAMANCSGVTSVHIPNSVTVIEHDAFKYCSNLPSIVLPSNLTSIEHGTFQYCQNLKSVVIPDKVKTIHDQAFQYCQSLKIVTIGKGVEKIEYEAFRGSESLSSVYCRANQVPSMEWDVFSQSNVGNATLYVPSNDVGSYENAEQWKLFGSIQAYYGVFYDAYIDGIYYVFDNTSRTASVTHQAYYYHNEYAYSGNVTIPESVNYNGISYRVNKIGYDALAHCNGVTSINIPNGVTEIEHDAFKNCENLPSLSLPSNITSIEHGTCQYCQSLSSFVVPDNVTIIHDQAFQYCRSLNTLTIGKSIEKIEYEAFRGCESLTTVYSYANQVPSLERDVFNGVNLSNATLYVPSALLNAYRTSEQWNQFGTITAFDSTEPEGDGAFYEYFSIYFKDGTKSEPFYATDVESIEYSKLDLDFVEHTDWQVQEIYTSDSVYRYSLAQIDRIDFKDVDVNKVAEDIANVIIKCETLLNDNGNLIIMESLLSEIKQFEEVDDAYISNRTLFVDINNWGCISYYFPLDENGNHNSSLSRVLGFSTHSQPIGDHNSSNPLSACIINQQAMDQNRSWFIDIANNVKGAFENMGIGCKIVDMPDYGFFIDGIFDYDLVFLKTHGCYDTKYGLHWLYSGQELFSHSGKTIYYNSIFEKIHQFFRDHYLSPLKLTISCVEEKRNGNKTYVYYIVISDKYIKSAKNKFKNKGSAIVFNTACESMKGNIINYNNLANAFINRGAGVYLGYDDPNYSGAWDGSLFYFCLLNGMSVSRAYDITPHVHDLYIYYVNGEQKIDNQKMQEKNYVEEYHPYLLMETTSPEQCITHPETLDIGNTTGSGGTTKLYGKMKMLKTLVVDDKNTFSYDGHIFGFQYSTNSDMSQADTIKAERDYDDNTLYMNWETTIDESALQPNTTYYYRAYMNDGYSNCYGEIKSFTTKDNGSGGEDTSNYEAYFVLKDSLCTFYFDAKRYERGGRKLEVFVKYYLDYYYHGLIAEEIKKVIFDSSFAKYLPNSTMGWFYGCSKLETIENIQYLNTSNVSSMYDMFSGCKSLTSLDLSSFNTANVKSMSDMFSGCNSIKDIDINNLNMSNVESTNRMFLGCHSLTHLNMSNCNTSKLYSMENMFSGCNSLSNLDLSSFNTTNVTNMSGLFGGCSSLTSLDLSSFNTANVTNMAYMFSGCASLTSIDVSNFVTDNAYIGGMFMGCSSLTCLDLSNFKCEEKRVDSMFEGCSSLRTIYARNWGGVGSKMFYQCNNLVGEQGTKVGENICYDSQGNPLYYYCEYDIRAAHIDGGKDNPGLFTAK